MIPLNSFAVFIGNNCSHLNAIDFEDVTVYTATGGFADKSTTSGSWTEVFTSSYSSADSKCLRLLFLTAGLSNISIQFCLQPGLTLKLISPLR